MMVDNIGNTMKLPCWIPKKDELILCGTCAQLASFLTIDRNADIANMAPNSEINIQVSGGQVRLAHRLPPQTPSQNFQFIRPTTPRQQVLPVPALAQASPLHAHRSP